jgi:hypothetical protein
MYNRWMVLELLRLGTMLLIPHQFHLLWQKLLQHWSTLPLCWPRIRMQIRVVGVETTEERPLMWISPIHVHQCSQKLMRH